MIDMSVQIGRLHLKNPVFLAAGPLTTKCYERSFWSPDTKILNWMLGLWDNEFLCINDAVKFIKIAKQQLNIPIFGNFKEDSDRIEQWMMLAKRLEDAGADALITFFTFIHEFVGKEIEMMERIIARVCSAVSIPVIFKIQPLAGLSTDIPEMAGVMEDIGIGAIQISDGIGGYPTLDIDKPPYHPFNCIDFQARDGFISGPYLKPLVYKTVYEYASQTSLPIICSGEIWDAQSAIEAILYGSSMIASSSGPCIKGWKMFNDITQGIENYMKQNNYSLIKDFKGLAGQFIKENDLIDYPDCYATVDELKCTGCEQCLPPAHCNAITMDENSAKINREICVGCCVCIYLCPENAIEMNMV